MKAWKGLQPGQAISASEYSRLCKAVFESYGTGAARVSIANGRMQIHVDSVAASTDHPFKINAIVEPELGVSIIVTISNGSIDYKTPLFKGEMGEPISDSPAPDYTFAPSAGIYRVYLVVTVDKNGYLADDQDVWIEIPDVANEDLPDDVPPVPDDMPEPGDTGTAGLIHIQLGYITVAVVEDVITVSTFNDVRKNFTFWLCDNGQYTINPIS